MSCRHLEGQEQKECYERKRKRMDAYQKQQAARRNAAARNISAWEKHVGRKKRRNEQWSKVTGRNGTKRGGKRRKTKRRKRRRRKRTRRRRRRR